MTHLELARKIPAEYRRAVLEENLIYKAISVGTDTHMGILFTIWKNYMEIDNEDLDLACGYCLDRILKSYKVLQPYLIELEKADKLLED